ncbi:MarR family transcriptional regulator [Vibrio parahaemolyticus]|uniref:MarR family transcriptional regulator n=1 Tax=Vibrio parahaemolyticus TaxID=670 RepID=UPI00042A22B3|nr:MarR family transcriptional regulator [Vibrio parahaemolyticus]
MFGFFKRKAFKVLAVNLLQELVNGRLRDGKYFGLNAEDICKKTGLNLISTINLLNRLTEYGLIEEYDFLDVACYRAINVPEYLDCTSSPNAIFGYAKRAIDRVDFKGLV